MFDELSDCFLLTLDGIEDTVEAVVVIRLGKRGRRRRVEETHNGVHLTEKEAVATVVGVHGGLFVQGLHLSLQVFERTRSGVGVTGFVGYKCSWLRVVVPDRCVVSFLWRPVGKYLFPPPASFRTLTIVHPHHRSAEPGYPP